LDPKHEATMYWGYKFEQYATKSRKEDEETVNTNCAFCSVVKTRFDNHKILMVGEVDCSENGHVGLPNYIELKTSKVMVSDKDNYNFMKFKMLKFWVQSFLIGVPKVIVGFRDDKGIVQKVEEFPVATIPKKLKGKNAWNPNTLFHFFNEFLQWLRGIVFRPSSRYMVEFKEPFQEFSVTVENDVPDYLPEWYRNNPPKTD